MPIYSGSRSWSMLFQWGMQGRSRGGLKKERLEEGRLTARGGKMESSPSGATEEGLSICQGQHGKPSKGSRKFRRGKMTAIPRCLSKPTRKTKKGGGVFPLKKNNGRT